MVNFNEIIGNLIDIGFYSVVLPFILVYAVVFAILEKSGIFSKSGENEKQTKNVNAIIAFVFGLFVVASIQTVKYIQSLITNIIIVIIFILVVLILLGFIFGEDYFKFLFKKADDKPNYPIIFTIAGVVFLVALGILFTILGVWETLDNLWKDITSSGLFSTIIVILVIGGILVWITKGSNSGNT